MTAFIVVALGMALLACTFIWRPLSTPGEAPAARGLALALSAGLVAFSALVFAWVVRDPLPLDRIEGEAAGVATPLAPAPAASGAAAPTELPPEAIAAMVQRLADRLKDQPDDAPGWRMLARSYENLGRFGEAVQAYRSLLRVQGPDADVLSHYAVALGMTLGQRLSGEPEAALQEALRLDPRHPQALALSGSAAFEREDYAAAIAQWEKLLSLIPPDSDMRASIEANVAKARTLGASGQGRTGVKGP